MNDHTPSVTRRGVLAAGGAALVGATGGFALGRVSAPADAPAAATPASPAAPSASPAASPAASTSASTGAAIPFHGAHQPGVTTAPAVFQTFVGLDLRRARRDDALAVMRLVTDDAARLMAGKPSLGDPESLLAANPAGLTTTVGLGRRLFDRLGLLDRVPPELAEIPAFATDAFEEPWSQTDLLLQVGSDDPLTLAHALRVHTLSLSTLAEVRWSQPGFRSPAPAQPGSRATRNLMGQVDGTVNPADDQLAAAVWLPDGPQWWARGTVLVLRRIRMHLDEWSELDPVAQEQVIGRRLDTGAPLGGAHEDDPVPFDALDAQGLPVIDTHAHIRVAHAQTDAEMILRRPYSYDAGPRAGRPDAGLLFAAYARDPRVSFVPMQQRIATSDAFNRWNTTIGSAAYLVPGGVAEGAVLAGSAFA